MTLQAFIQGVRDRLMRIVPLAWTTPIGLCALTGFIGVLSGFALFILLWHDPETGPWKLLGILGLAAVLSFFFEYLRGEIEGHDEARWSLNNILTTLVMLAMFELFVTALHSAASITDYDLSLTEIAIVGPRFLAFIDTAAANLLLMVVAWVVIGVILAGWLGRLIARFEAAARKHPAHRARWANVLRGAALGGAGALLAGALVVVVYILGVRVITEIRWMNAVDFRSWAQYVSGIETDVPWIPLGAGVKLCLRAIQRLTAREALAAIFSSFAGLYLLARTVKSVPALVWAFVAANILGTVILLLVVPLAGRSPVEGVEQLGAVVGLVAVIWFLPGAVLGATVAHLERPSEHRRIWGFIALAVAVTLEIVAKEKAFASAVALVLAIAGMLLLSRVPIEKYWVAIALGAAFVALGCTEIANANFVDVQSESLDLVSTPLGGSASGTSAYSILFNRNGGFAVAHAGNPRPERLTLPKPSLAGSGDPGDPGGFIAGSTRVLLQYRDRNESLLSAVLKPSDPGAKTLHNVVRNLFKEDTDAFLSERKVSRERMGELTTVVAIMNQPEFVFDINAIRIMLDRHATLASEALDQVKLNLSAADKEFETACRSKKWSQEFCSTDGRRKRASRIETLKAAEDELSESIAVWEITRKEFENDDTKTTAAIRAVSQMLPVWKAELIEMFELCINGSLGFWVTIGLLAGWSVQKTRTGAI